MNVMSVTRMTDRVLMERLYRARRVLAIEGDLPQRGCLAV